MDSSQENVYLPNQELFEQSHFTALEEYKALYDKSINEGDEFWDHLGRTLLNWRHEFQLVSDCDFEDGLISWYLGEKSCVES